MVFHKTIIVDPEMSASRYKKQFSRNCAHCNYKVILLGDYGVGKTSLFRKLKGGKQPQSLDSITSSSGVSHDTIDYCTKVFTMSSGKKVQVKLNFVLPTS